MSPSAEIEYSATQRQLQSPTLIRYQAPISPAVDPELVDSWVDDEARSFAIQTDNGDAPPPIEPDVSAEDFDFSVDVDGPPQPPPMLSLDVDDEPSAKSATEPRLALDLADPHAVPIYSDVRFKWLEIYRRCLIAIGILSVTFSAMVAIYIGTSALTNFQYGPVIGITSAAVGLWFALFCLILGVFNSLPWFIGAEVLKWCINTGKDVREILATLRSR